jgi:hypothetical protein
MTTPDDPRSPDPDLPPPPAGGMPPGSSWPASGGGWTGAGAGAPPGHAASAPSAWQGTSWEAAPQPAPAARAQPGLVLGVILIIVGGALLVGRVVDISAAWPLWMIVPGLAMVAGSLFIPPRGGLGLAIPGAIIASVGGVLWVQETYGLYTSWLYAWALVAPTSVGLAMLVYGLAQRDRELAVDGLRTTFVGLVLFAVLGLFFEGVLGLNGYAIANLDEALPYLALGLGVVLVVVSLFTGRRRPDRSSRA